MIAIIAFADEYRDADALSKVKESGQTRHFAGQVICDPSQQGLHAYANDQRRFAGCGTRCSTLSAAL